MSNQERQPFPTKLTQPDETYYAHAVTWDNPCLQRALDRLRLMGIDLQIGMTLGDSEQVLQIANSPLIREYCPREPGRFSNPDKWVAKGRQPFIYKLNDESIVAYGWSGPELTVELPDYPITTAYRVDREKNAAHLPKGIGSLVVATTVGISNELYGPAGHGLETWGSNDAAIKTYLRNGAVLIKSKAHDENGERILRPTLLEDSNATIFDSDNNAVTPDTRIYMGFPWTLPQDHPNYRAFEWV